MSQTTMRAVRFLIITLQAPCPMHEVRNFAKRKLTLWTLYGNGLEDMQELIELRSKKMKKLPRNVVISPTAYLHHSFHSLLDYYFHNCVACVVLT